MHCESPIGGHPFILAPMKIRTGLIALAAMLLPFAGPAQAEITVDSPTVVELFTSQGCSSCPPADRLLEELTERDDVLALGYHVDYWDYIGWADPFASRESTMRQRLYGRAFDLRSVFTPQMVVDGAVSVVGSRRREVTRAIEAAPQNRPQTVAVSVEQPDPSRFIVSLGAADYDGEPADIVLVRYDKAHVTEVERGENRGRTLTDVNVVRQFDVIGQWRGEPITITANMPVSDIPGGCAVLVQLPGHGPILGAARIMVQPGT